MTSYKNFIVGFGFRICAKFEEDQANILPNRQVCSLFYSTTRSNQKVAMMATPEVNEKCHRVQNDPHRCKIELEKFHFVILWGY